MADGSPRARKAPTPSSSAGGRSSRGAEKERLRQAREQGVGWKAWGPYLSERQWGTVREDTSADGNAWASFPYEHSIFRAYRWGEDGLAGFSDDHQRLCFALALWNGRDAHLKERLFGLTNGEGNHGEDVKEYYFYLDSTPTHSWMKWLYKYPQAAYPYQELRDKNRERGRTGLEYELVNTGIFRESRYFDVTVVYAKASPEDVLVQIEAVNRGPEAAELHVLPTLWFRAPPPGTRAEPAPSLRATDDADGTFIEARHPELGTWRIDVEGTVGGNTELLFTDNVTNTRRLGAKGESPRYAKDGFHAAVVEGKRDAVRPEKSGTKSCAHARWRLAPGERRTMRLRLSRSDGAGALPSGEERFGKAFDEVLAAREREADEFYAGIGPATMDEDERRIHRQALAGMLWTKQYFGYDVGRWLTEKGIPSTQPMAKPGMRNRHWFHMVNDHVVSMPDKWEYPWYAAWDLAFHAVPLAMVDLDFAKEQLELLLGDAYLHPNGQIPAYEWNFSDVNPPVHAWAARAVFMMEANATGKGDLGFLRRVFQKLLANFTWWVNRKDPTGKNVFEGGFLGLDNIGAFDRSAPLPAGWRLEQADGTAWMAFYSQVMLQIALELAKDDASYGELAVKFAQHFLWIASAMDGHGGRAEAMWDEEDGFFYDFLATADGKSQRLKVRSMVGLLPLCAATVLQPGDGRFRPLGDRVREFVARRPEVLSGIAPPTKPGQGGSHLLAVLDETKLRRVLSRMLDEGEFLSDYGIRSLSKHHERHPYEASMGAEKLRVGYEPAESQSGMFGGNSNWRGPIWWPTNFLVLRALLHYHEYYGPDWKVECPTGSGRMMNLHEVAQEISERLVRVFRRDAHGRRPVYGGTEIFQKDPHWKDLLLFYEYFHGDNGAGIGASHQTGWTGLVATLLAMLEKPSTMAPLHAPPSSRATETKTPATAP